MHQPNCVGVSTWQSWQMPERSTTMITALPLDLYNSFTSFLLVCLSWQRNFPCCLERGNREWIWCNVLCHPLMGCVTKHNQALSKSPRGFSLRWVLSEDTLARTCSNTEPTLKSAQGSASTCILMLTSAASAERKICFQLENKPLGHTFACMSLWASKWPFKNLSKSLLLS